MTSRPASPPTTLVAVAHGPERLRQACRDVATLLLFRALEYPAADAPLVGVWVADAEPPPVLRVPHSRRTIPVYETVGVGGVWTLCQLPGALSRATLVATLASGADAPDAVFVPIYRADEREAARAEGRRLAARFPGRVAEPLCHHPATGRVIPFPRLHDPTP